MSKVLVEVCVGSVADIRAAAAGGADRVELCGGLELGGLTPSLGLVETALAASPLPVVVMLRPRAGGFLYDADEFRGLLVDAVRFRELGAAGFAVGLLDRRGEIDAARCRELVERISPAAVTFHRAFDFVPNPSAALEVLSQVGVCRVLTSGGAASALAGGLAVRRLVEQAAGRLAIMAGGGIAADHAAAVAQATGCRELHIGASRPTADGSIAAGPVELCDARFFHGVAHRTVSPDAVAATVEALRS